VSEMPTGCNARRTIKRVREKLPSFWTRAAAVAEQKSGQIIKPVPARSYEHSAAIRVSRTEDESVAGATRGANAVNTFFTADTHFGHANIIRHCDRPFADVEAMNRGITDRWNAVVGPHDLVYHLGDFAMGDAQRWPEYRAALNGRIVLVLGNHDRSAEKMLAIGIDEVVSNVVVVVEGVRCWLNHYPPAEDGTDYKGRPLGRPKAPSSYDLALCGHIHEKWRVRDGMVNVGVDVWAYAPVLLSALLEARGSEAAPRMPVGFEPWHDSRGNAYFSRERLQFAFKRMGLTAENLDEICGPPSLVIDVPRWDQKIVWAILQHRANEVRRHAALDSNDGGDES